MARQPLQIEIYLDHIHCHDEGDGIGNAEPYLWTIYFKIDGDTVFLGDDLFLHGTCTVVTTPGSHGNLGDNDVDAGDDVAVPSALGEFTATLKPIPVTDVARNLGVEDVGGVVGVAVVLMEEDWVTDAGAEAGHVALNKFIEQAINDLIPTLGVTHQDVTEDDINALTDKASDAVGDAVANAQSTWHNVTSWLNSDDQIGSKVFKFTHDSFVADAFQSFSQRWKNEGDWELFGQASGVPTCPVATITTVLKSQRLLNEAQIGAVLGAGHEFRRKVFAGRPALGAWWTLVERNTAAIARILNDDPELTKRFGAAAVVDLASTVGSGGTLSDATLQNASAVLDAFATRGPRRLRIDAKAAQGMLPSLRGSTIDKTVTVLTRSRPTRKPNRPIAER